MAKRSLHHANRQVAKSRPANRGAARAPEVDWPAPDGDLQASGLSLHELFQQQAMTMLERADLSEEQKQSILVAMNCPCCGAGGLSYTVKLKRRR